MKRKGYLYHDMCDKDLIAKAIHKALINKKKHCGVKEVLAEKDKYVEFFYNSIKNGTYKFQVGYFKTIKSGTKTREIQVPTLKDHIMQHIIMAVLTPIIMKGMYHYNCGVIPKRGPIYAKRYLEKIITKYKPKYVLKLDIKKYFHNIDTNILMSLLERHIKDERFLMLIKDMLDTANQGTGKGIPIGFYSSQWLSNFYLQGLDYYIKQELKVEWYLRYMDDLVLLGNNKRKLQRIKIKIFKYMSNNLKIEPNNKHQVFPLRKRHIDFVGYLFSYNKTKIRKQTFKLYKRRLKAVQQNKNIFLCRSYMSIRGWLIHCDIGRSFLAHHESKSLVNKIKKYISKKDKEEQYAKLCKSY